jgi:hypothetical protein
MINLGSAKLTGVAEQLIGKTVDKLVGTDLEEIHAAIAKVQEFKQTYSKKLQALAHNSLRASLNLAYNQSSSRAALVDVELDVSQPKGQELARRAAMGDFSETLSMFDSPLVRINRGEFTHTTASSTELQVNLLGFGIQGLTRVIQKSSDALEMHEGGLLHVYTTDTMIEQRRKSGGELTASTFVLSTAARGMQGPGEKEYLICTLPKMSVTYHLVQEDDKASPTELTQILDFAEVAGLLPDAHAFAEQLRREFPKGLGKVRAEYIVRYGPEDVTSAFMLNDGLDRQNLRSLVRRVMRHYIAAKYTGMPQTFHAAPLGFAYLDDIVFQAFREAGFATFKNLHVRVTLPGWFTKGAPQRPELSDSIKQVLTALYNVEASYINKLVKLDVIMDELRAPGAAVDPKVLDKLAKDFVSMADNLDEFRENAFFAVFD